jgi:hypothetical protein
MGIRWMGAMMGATFTIMGATWVPLITTSRPPFFFSRDVRSLSVAPLLPLFAGGNVGADLAAPVGRRVLRQGRALESENPLGQHLCSVAACNEPSESSELPRVVPRQPATASLSKSSRVRPESRGGGVYRFGSERSGRRSGPSLSITVESKNSVQK